MPYTKTVWVDNSVPALNGTNLNHITDELEAQALAKGVAHTLPNWANGVTPAVSDAAPLNEMERVARAVGLTLSLNYTVTTWQANWTPARNAANLNKLENAVAANRVAIDGGGASWPASYTNGPLGANNVLPNTSTGALIVLWHDNTTSTATKRTEIIQRAKDCYGVDGSNNPLRFFDCIGIHYGGIDSEIPGRGGSNLGSGAELWAHQQGAVPVISWTHNRTTKGTTNLNTMTEINNGLHDAYFTEAANYWKGLGFRVILRPVFEFDGVWFPWSPTSSGAGNSNDGFPNPGCTAAAWITAWQRMVGLFQAAGANKVGFHWCPTEGYNRAVATSCYPGNTYVDWVGSDVYNQADNTTGTYNGSNHPVQTGTLPVGGGWSEFWQMFNYTGHGTATVCKHDEFGPNKPFVVGETGTLYDGTDVNRKANWYRNIQANAFGKPDMPYLCGIEFFDTQNVANDGFDWLVDNNQTYVMAKPNGWPGVASTAGSTDAVTYQGFKDFAANANWKVGVTGGAT